MARLSLRALATRSEELAPAVELGPRRCHVFDNLADGDPAFARQMAGWVYANRRASILPIELVALPAATVLPVDQGLVVIGPDVIAEQVLDNTVIDDLPACGDTVETAETVVLTRFGASTWGHWLGELLPKVALVEQAHPGRFRYLVPPTHLPGTSDHHRPYQESLVALGIAADRLVPLPHDGLRLTAPFAVTPVWSHIDIHPAASGALRDALPVRAGGPAKVALLRRPERARRLVNENELLPLLTDEGYEPIDIEGLPFAEQVALMRGATHVCATLGSALTGLLFAPEGVRVLSFAPHPFGDWFFYGLVQDRQGRFADVRGSVVEVDSLYLHRSSFRVDRAVVTQALRHLD